MSERVGVGVRVKTGRAIVVVLAGNAKKPRAVERCELTLWDRAVRYSGQPYHAPLELGEKRGAQVLEKALDTVRSAGKSEVTRLLESLAAAGHLPRAVGFVVGSLGDPAKIGNPHVRAHALEGQLYWRVLDEPARELGLDCSVVTEKELQARTAESLGVKPDALRAGLAELGKAFGRPWGAEEKCAALAAWSALSA